MDVKIDIRRMREVAREVDSQLNIVRSCLESITKDALGLNGNEHWLGDSAIIYYETIKNLCHGTVNPDAMNAQFIINTLHGYVTHLNATADKFEATEHRIESRVAALPSDVFDI